MAKKIVILLLAVFFFIVVLNNNAWCAYMDGSAPAGYWHSFQKWQAEQTNETEKARVMMFLGYVMGVVHADGNALYIPGDAPTGQLAVVVGRYLDSHPNELQQSGSNLVVKAIQQAYQKK
jgi:hypothetical protein